jgi:NADH:ubiquinone oxidoreductase subunit 3 (subunit A)
MADLMWSGAGLSCFKPTPTASDVIIPTAVYTLSLPLVQLADGWDAGACAIGEDMHMMLKCYFATKGLLRIESLSSPASLCNVSTSKKGIRGWVENHCARYSQGLRHMWGSLDSGYAIGLWLKMRKDVFSSPSSSPTRLPRSRKLSETGPRLDPFDLTTPRRFTWRTMVLFMRLFEAHFLVTHLLLIILASSIFHALPWSSRFECLDWTMHITEGFRFIGFAIMTAYFVLVYDDYHRTCVAVREWELKQAGLYDVSHFSYRSKWSFSSIFDSITFPLAGMLFGSVPLFQAVFSHFWTDNLVYIVSAKPIRILAEQVGISANGMDGTKESISKHSTAV